MRLLGLPNPRAFGRTGGSAGSSRLAGALGVEATGMRVARTANGTGDFGRFFHGLGTPVMCFDLERFCVEANVAACRMLQREKNRLLSMRLDDLVIESEKALLPGLWTGLAGSRKLDGRHCFLLPGGQELCAEFAVTANIVPGVHAAVYFPAADGPRSPEKRLSDREREVLTLLARGGDNKSIAGELFLAPETVRNYTRSARMKLGAKSRSHAIALAIASGQIQV